MKFKGFNNNRQAEFFNDGDPLFDLTVRDLTFAHVGLTNLGSLPLLEALKEFDDVDGSRLFTRSAALAALAGIAKAVSLGGADDTLATAQVAYRSALQAVEDCENTLRAETSRDSHDDG